MLQGQQTLINNSMKMEKEIASLKEDNKKLQSFIHEEILSGLNQLTKIVINKNTSINQSITSLSNTYMKEFKLAHKNNIVLNDNIKTIIEGNQTIEKEIVSIKEKLSSTLVEQKLDNLEKTVENLQLLQSDSPMDMTPTPQPHIPLPSMPQPPIITQAKQSTRPTYTSITGSKIRYQPTAWQDTPGVNNIGPNTAPFPKSAWTIHFPHKFGPKERPATEVPIIFKFPPHRIVMKLNQKLFNKPIEVILAKRTLRNNITLTFSQELKEKDIMDASTTIIESLGLQDKQAIFSRAVNGPRLYSRTHRAH